MNTIVTSKEAILQNCKELVSENGLSSLNMRAVAQKCNVALGSLYNYFPSKSDLTLATIESVWHDIFHVQHPHQKSMFFPDYVQWIFESIQAGMVAYPNFFTAHSIGFASENKGQAKQKMDFYFRHMKNGLLEALKNDSRVQQDTFDDKFTQSDFVDFALSGVMTLLMQNKSNCTVLLKMIERSIY